MIIKLLCFLRGSPINPPDQTQLMAYPNPIFVDVLTRSMIFINYNTMIEFGQKIDNRGNKSNPVYIKQFIYWYSRYREQIYDIKRRLNLGISVNVYEIELINTLFMYSDLVSFLSSVGYNIPE
ncbi:hypothetical protein DMUE_2609 [Dictyocoela muelleri]|nr:hypothetical protein DMUE_2609 [Dictyocoela muelleri]